MQLDGDARVTAMVQAMLQTPRRMAEVFSVQLENGALTAVNPAELSVSLLAGGLDTWSSSLAQYLPRFISANSPAEIPFFLGSMAFMTHGCRKLKQGFLWVSCCIRVW
jgi:hypothetical protein